MVDRVTASFGIVYAKLNEDFLATFRSVVRCNPVYRQARLRCVLDEATSLLKAANVYGPTARSYTFRLINDIRKEMRKEART